VGVERATVEVGSRYVLKVRCKVAAINDLVEALIGTGTRIHRVEYDEISPLFEP